MIQLTATSVFGLRQNGWINVLVGAVVRVLQMGNASPLEPSLASTSVTTTTTAEAAGRGETMFTMAVCSGIDGEEIGIDEPKAKRPRLAGDAVQQVHGNDPRCADRLLKYKTDVAADGGWWNERSSIRNVLW